MLTYALKENDRPFYQQVYSAIKKDILAGRLTAHTKLPSKRAFAKHLGLSTITIENAYDQLIAEGYLYTQARKGYFVAKLQDLGRYQSLAKPTPIRLQIKEEPDLIFDFSSSQLDTTHFPFSVMAKMMRQSMSDHKEELLERSPSAGILKLRQAIADHLASFRGMQVDPQQIVIGAGTEYLYGLLVQLLGADKIYCIENPGYKKLKKIYEAHRVTCQLAAIDQEGVKVSDLKQVAADIAHINPTHHFPTGISMPINRRYELLAWVNEEAGRYIIEDDYDSEFRFTGKPLPSLQSIDASEKVIYLNTFSKSLTSTIRISYMVLPLPLAKQYHDDLAFYSCTVSCFEQYWLANFISQGYFEKHINRMRLYYGRKRSQVMDCIHKQLQGQAYRIIENQSGLHFLLEVETSLSDQAVKQALLDQGIGIHSVSDYDMSIASPDSHCFLIQYAGFDIPRFKEALNTFKNIVFPKQ